MGVSIKAPRGTQDILPHDSYKWKFIQDLIFEVCKNFGFNEIRTPTFESTELFSRGVGDSSEVVQKEMYTFLDKSDRSLTLRPEGTACVVRSVLENGLLNSCPLPLKVFYFGSFYRYEKPQAGRLREFHQFGVEMFGSSSVLSEVEVILLAIDLFERLSLKNINLELNSIGCDGCRPGYNILLKDYFFPLKAQLCKLCSGRLETNPFRIFDCKNPSCQEIFSKAPLIIDNICSSCDENFKELTSYLEKFNVTYRINGSIVRGLDYYNRTVFEFVSEDLGAKSTICGGGRYDSLVEKLGGNKTQALGFGLGVERLLMIIEKQSPYIWNFKKCDLYVANLEGSESKAFEIAYKVSRSGFFAECDLIGRSFKSQLKYANKIGSRYLLVVGEEEISSGFADLKNMKTGEINKVQLVDGLICSLKKSL